MKYKKNGGGESRVGGGGVRVDVNVEVFVKIKKNIGGGVGGGGSGWGGQDGCERRIEVFEKIQTSSPKGNDRSPNSESSKYFE